MIFTYFDRDYKNIFVNSNVDSIGEMALSYKLAEKFDDPVVKETVEFLDNKYDKEFGYIQSETRSNIGIAEHRNIIAVMVLLNFRKLFKGPNLKTMNK